MTVFANPVSINSYQSLCNAVEQETCSPRLLFWSLVKRLLRSRGPSAISRLVIPVNVDAVNRVLVGRPWPHVVTESLKAFFPSIANGNSSRAVILEAFDFIVAAPINHRLPDTINLSLRLAMLRVSVRCSFNLKTATRVTFASFKAFSRRCVYVPTIANALPVMNGAATILLSVGMFGYGPTAKALTCNVNKFAHSFLAKAARVCRVRQGFTSKAVSGATLAGPSAYTMIEAKI
jgi:hypothetical protein